MISIFSAVVLKLNIFGDSTQALLLLVDTKKGECWGPAFSVVL